MTTVADALDSRPVGDAPEELLVPHDVQYSNWTGHVIVCGLQTVVVQTVEQLLAAGARVVVIDDEGSHDRALRAFARMSVPVLARRSRTGESLVEAGIAGAKAVISIESSDLRTLETVMLARGLRQDVRVIAQLDNPALARAVEEKTGEATVIDVASLFSPPVIEACIKRRAHDIKIGSTHFVTIEVVAPVDGTLRELYGNLVPLGVANDSDAEPVVCPGRDHRVQEGSRVTLLGTREDVHAAGFGGRLSAGAEIQQTRERLVGAVRRLTGELTSDSSRSLRVALGLGLALLVVSTLVLHFGYQRASGGLGLISAVYFTVETVATVGFGDFSFSTQPVYMEIFGIFYSASS
jgi:Trk K+ transport system NAD-binding subunit